MNNETAKTLQDASEAFDRAIIDGLRSQAAANGGKLSLSVEVLKAAAFPAVREVVEAFSLTPMQAVVIWEGSLKINGSAFEQHCGRLAKARTLGFELETKVTRQRGLAMQYAE